MKKIAFLAHDPGGYDAVYPVLLRFLAANLPCEAFFTGPAAVLRGTAEVKEEGILAMVQARLANRELAGIVTGTSWGSTVELKATALCRQAGIPTMAILDYWSNYQKRFQDGEGNLEYPDYYIVMDDLARAEAVADGVPEAIIYPLGHPGLDKYINRKKSCGLRKNNKRILFLSQPLSQLYGTSLGYTEQEVLEDCLQAARELDARLVVKYHPKDNLVYRQKYAEFAIEGTLEELVPECGITIGMNTMALLHAALMGAAVLSYQPGLQQTDICITNRLRVTQLIGNYRELVNCLKTCDKKTAERALFDNYIWSDGCSTERVMGFIREVMLNEN